MIDEENDPLDIVLVQQQIQYAQQVGGRKKYQRLLAAENTSAVVQGLPAQELYLLIKELGVADVADLIGLASPEQVTLCVDMDCWTDDELDADDSLQWLQLMLMQDEDDFLRLMDGFDFELLVVMVKKQLTILSGLESLHDDEDLMAQRKRFDQVYDCNYRNADAEKIMSAFQDVMFRERQELFLQVMEAVRHEFDSALQQDVFESRNRRLEDFGFSDSGVARALYTYLDPERFNPEHYLKPEKLYFDDSGLAVAPTFMLTMVAPRDLLGELLAGGLPPNIGHELGFLLNRVLSADRVDFGDLEQVALTLEDVYHYLNIALGAEAGSDLNRAEHLLNHVYLRTLYQLGFTLTLQLRRRAEAILASAIGPYLDGPDAALISALCQPKPRFYSGLSDPLRANQRPFQCWAEVLHVRSELDCVEALTRLFSRQGVFELLPPQALDLHGCLPAQGHDVTLSELFLTALANRLLGRDFVPEPIAVAELPVLHGKLTASTEFLGELRQQTHQWLEDQAPGSGAFAGFCLDIWEQEFCALALHELTPHYIGGLIIRL